MFNIGDKVICNDDARTGGLLKEGKIYTVKSKHSLFNDVNFVEQNMYWNVNRFSKVPDGTIFAGDDVICIDGSCSTLVYKALYKVAETFYSGKCLIIDGQAYNENRFIKIPKAPIMDFKRGDKVLCIEPTGPFQFGKIYTVDTFEGWAVKIGDNWANFKRFIHVLGTEPKPEPEPEPEPEFELGDLICCKSSTDTTDLVQGGIYKILTIDSTSVKVEAYGSTYPCCKNSLRLKSRFYPYKGKYGEHIIN